MTAVPDRDDSVLTPDVDVDAQASPTAPGHGLPDVTTLGEKLRDDRAVRSLALTTLAALAVVYTLYLGREFARPIVFALLLQFLLSPVVRSMRRARIPTAAGAGLVVLALCAGIGGVIYSLADPAQEWIARAPKTMGTLSTKIRKLRRPVEQVTRSAEQVAKAADLSGNTRAQEVVVTGPSLSERLFGGTQVFVVALLEIVVLLYFLLAAGDLFLQKLIKVLPQLSDKRKAVQIARETESSVSAYLLTVTVLNVALGVVTSVIMTLLHMPNAVLWGVLAGLLEFMPYIGATLMTVVLAVAGVTTFDNVGHGLLVPLSYFVVDFLNGNFIVPYMLGRRLTLNPVAILVGIAFWWQIWGIPGAFLAVPLLATFKILCDNIETLSPIGEFLGK